MHEKIELYEQRIKDKDATIADKDELIKLLKSMNILYGLGAVVLGVFCYWIYLTVKAMKDPDVQIASDLRMSIKRYRHYQRLYDEYQLFMIEHGAHSQASEKKYVEIFKQIDNPNEWRRYQAYREQKQRDEFMKEIFK